MVETDCPFCHQAADLHFQTKDYNRRISTEIFTYYRCQSCGLIFLSQVPSNLSDYYTNEYYEIPNSIEQLSLQSNFDLYKIHIIKQFFTSGRILEIGPAYGTFAYLAKLAGFIVETIELDGRCCIFLEDIVGIRAIHSGDIPAALISCEPYNIIALWHVIEHLDAPWTALDAMVTRLLPGGILVIAAPNPDSFQFKLFGKYWTHIDAPRHLTLLPTYFLIKKLETLGLKMIMYTTTDKGSISWNDFGWRRSLSNIFPPHPVIMLLASLAGRASRMMFSPIEKLEGQGSAYTLVFQKESKI